MGSLGDGAVASAVVAGTLGRTTQSLSRTRESLIDKGLVAPAGSGYLVFTLAHFAAYVRSREASPATGLASDAFSNQLPLEPTPARKGRSGPSAGGPRSPGRRR